MLRIDVSQRPGEGAVVRLDGRLVGPWVAELRRTCQAVLADGSEVVLDMADVSFVDRDGADLLRSLRNGRVALSNCSRFVIERLKG